MHDEFAGPAECHAADGGDGRNQAVSQALRCLLELGDDCLERLPFSRLHRRAQRREIGAQRERLTRLPDDQSAPVSLGFGDRREQSVEHVGANGVLLGLERDDGDVVAGMPHPHRVGFQDRRAHLRFLAEDRIGKVLPRVDGQLRARMESIGRRRVRARRHVHACRSRAGRHPLGQRHRSKRLAGGNVLGNPLRDLPPAGGLPGLERAHLPAEAPANREVDVARVVRDCGEMKGAVMKKIAEDRP